MPHPFEIRFTLRQHTPIIHFQHEQAGATLRASEVKPKLDRFICKEWEHREKKPVPDTWKVGRKNREHGEFALNYKLHIGYAALKANFPSEPSKPYPQFFGNNQKDKSAPKKFFCFSDDIPVSIYCYSEELRTEIAALLLPFFGAKNFGNRQSKGFGSFYITEDSAFLTDYEIEYKLPKAAYSFKVEYSEMKSEKAKAEILFQHIDLFYRSLRSGINEPGDAAYTLELTAAATPKHWRISHQPSKFYCKPLIFLYAKDVWKKQWDKKSIKAMYFNVAEVTRKADKGDNRINHSIRESDDLIIEKGLVNQKIEYPSSDILTVSDTDNPHKDFKDLFGLSTDESWKSYGAKISKIHAFSKHDGSWAPRKKDNDPDKIHRYKSPIQFKPIDEGNGFFRVLIHYEPINPNYAGQKFSILNNRDKTRPPLTLEIPTGFDFGAFFNYFFNPTNFNIGNHVEKGFQDTEQFKILKGIYDQLQENFTAQHPSE